jgi:hypothetical protein
MFPPVVYGLPPQLARINWPTANCAPFVVATATSAGSVHVPAAVSPSGPDSPAWWPVTVAAAVVRVQRCRLSGLTELAKLVPGRPTSAGATVCPTPAPGAAAARALGLFAAGQPMAPAG